MPIAIVGTATTATSSGVCAAPTGLAAGHVLVASLGVYGGNPSSYTSPGWTQLLIATEHGGPGGSDLNAGFMYKVAGGSEPSSYTFAAPGSFGNLNVIIAAYSGVDNTTPMEPNSTANNSAGDNATVIGTGFSAGQAAERLVWTFFGDDTSLNSQPTGGIGNLTTRVDGATFLNLDSGTAGFYDGALVSSGATGNYTSSMGGADTWIVFMVGLNPAPPGSIGIPVAGIHYVTP